MVSLFVMKPPAFQFYADDFLAGTFSMSNEERGLYITLLCRQWTQGHVTRDEVARLGSTVVQPSINHVLTKFQPDADGNLKNARLEVERGKQNAFRLLQSEKGKASAKARFNRGSTVVQPSGAPEGNSPSPSPSPSNTNPLTPLQGEVPVAGKTKGLKAKGPLQLRAEALLKRRPETALSDAEVRAFGKARRLIEATTEDEWLMLERFYRAPQQETFSRKALAQVLNNWNGEIDRAKAWAKENGTRSSAGAPVLAPIPEPEGWQAYIDREFPACPWSVGGASHGAAWSAIPRFNQQVFVDDMVKTKSKTA